jgi:hypothetical protein
VRFVLVQLAIDWHKLEGTELQATSQVRVNSEITRRWLYR